jgi:hypothetical protein
MTCTYLVLYLCMYTMYHKVSHQKINAYNP